VGNGSLGSEGLLIFITEAAPAQWGGGGHFSSHLTGKFSQLRWSNRETFKRFYGGNMEHTIS